MLMTFGSTYVPVVSTFVPISNNYSITPISNNCSLTPISNYCSNILYISGEAEPAGSDETTSEHRIRFPSRLQTCQTLYTYIPWLQKSINTHQHQQNWSRFSHQRPPKYRDNDQRAHRRRAPEHKMQPRQRSRPVRSGRRGGLGLVGHRSGFPHRSPAQEREEGGNDGVTGRRIPGPVCPGVGSGGWALVMLSWYIPLSYHFVCLGPPVPTQYPHFVIFSRRIWNASLSLLPLKRWAEVQGSIKKLNNWCVCIGVCI